MFFEEVWALGLRIFYAKYFVFPTPPTVPETFYFTTRTVTAQ